MTLFLFKLIDVSGFMVNVQSLIFLLLYLFLYIFFNIFFLYYYYSQNRISTLIIHISSRIVNVSSLILNLKKINVKEKGLIKQGIRLKSNKQK